MADGSVGDCAIVVEGESGRSGCGCEGGDGIGGHPNIGYGRIVEGRIGKRSQAKESRSRYEALADASGAGVEAVLEFVGVAVVGLFCSGVGAVYDIRADCVDKDGGLGAAAQDPESIGGRVILAGIDVDVQLGLGLFSWR